MTDEELKRLEELAARVLSGLVEAVPKLIAALREEHKLADELASAVSFLLYPAEQEIREGINREATIKMSVEGVEELRGLTRARAVLTKHAARRGPMTAPRGEREGGAVTKSEEWTATIWRELEAAGFIVEHLAEYPMFPLVKMPKELDEGVRLMKLPLSFACERRIYAEGMLFLPLFAHQPGKERDK